MISLGRSPRAVFRPAHPVEGRLAFSEQRLQAPAQARGSAVIRVRADSEDRERTWKIHVGGFVMLRAPLARLSFASGEDGRPEAGGEPERSDVPLLPPATVVTIPDRVATRHGPEPPNAWISLVDSEGAQISPPVCVGRPSRRSLHLDPLFEIPVLVTLWLSACASGRGRSAVGLSGEIAARRAVVLRVALAPESNRFGLPGDAAEAFDIVALAPDARLAIPGRQVPAGAGGFPFVSVAMHHWDGRPSGGAVPVGRLTPLDRAVAGAALL